MHVLLKALVEGLSGKRISTAPAIAPRTQEVAIGKPRETTQAEFDELCAMFGIPENAHLLQQQGVSHGG